MGLIQVHCIERKWSALTISLRRSVIRLMRIVSYIFSNLAPKFEFRVWKTGFDKNCQTHRYIELNGFSRVIGKCPLSGPHELPIHHLTSGPMGRIRSTKYAVILRFSVPKALNRVSAVSQIAVFRKAYVSNRSLRDSQYAKVVEVEVLNYSI